MINLGRVACHGVKMRYDLHGASQFRLEANFAVVVKYFTIVFHGTP